MVSLEKRTPEIGWQEAVARLAHERTLAVTCAAPLKKHGDSGVIDRGALAYADATAEYDGIDRPGLVARGWRATMHDPPAGRPGLCGGDQRGRSTDRRWRVHSSRATSVQFCLRSKSRIPFAYCVAAKLRPSGEKAR